MPDHWRMITIAVVCVVLPDGGVERFELGSDDPSRVLTAWRDALPREKRVVYETAGVFGGALVTRMLRSDFRALQEAAATAPGKTGALADPHTEAERLSVHAARAAGMGAAGVLTDSGADAPIEPAWCAREGQRHG